VDHRDERLEGELVRLREGRLERARLIVEKLAELGAPIRLERVLQLARGGAVGRPHMALALMEAGYATTFGEAFDRYLGRQAPAYVERMKFSPAEACQLIRRSGGVPVLAHPVIFDATGSIKGPLPLDSMLPELIAAGLMGIEVYYPSYDARTTEGLMALARRHRLLITGGTDFHGLLSERMDLGGVYVPMKAVRRLRAAWEKLGT
jgi:3',5'-nucleoside bisphosphate phosphatase